MISIALPTRNRPHRLSTFLDSVISNADNHDSLEFLVYIDDDDNISANTLKQYKHLNIKQYNGQRLSVPAILNFLYRQSTGDIVGYLADDIRFLTPHWETEVRNAFTEDMICLVCPYEVHKGFQNACHGFLSRRAVESVGEFVPSYFKSAYGDQWLFEVYNSIGRFVKLDRVHISHDHPVFSKRRINPDLEMAKYWDKVYEEKNKPRNIKMDKRAYNIHAKERNKWAKTLQELCDD